MTRSSAELCLSVPVVHARKACATLKTLGLLDENLKPVVHERQVFFPLVRSKEVPRQVILKFNARVTYAPFPLPRKLIRVPSLRELRSTTRLEIPQSLTLVGDIALIGLLTAPEESWEVIGEAILKNYPVRGVFLREGETGGVFRIPRWRRLAGWGRPETVHVESGVWYYVDFERAFFNPRMQGERTRVEAQVRPEERVLDMFCGVGGFALRLVRRCREVYAVDINPDAIRMLEVNIELNGIPREKIVPICGDAARVVPSLEVEFDRIVMDYPAGAIQFLDEALSVAKRGAVIHLYVFKRSSTRAAAESEVVQQVSDVLRDVNFEIVRVRAQREVGTRRFLVSVDLRVL